MADAHSPHRIVPDLPRTQVLVLAALGIGVLWAYGPSLLEKVRRWSRDPRYSHGFLMPGFALVLLGVRVLGAVVTGVSLGDSQ